MRYPSWDEFLAAQRRSGLLQRISDFVTAERQKACRLCKNHAACGHYCSAICRDVDETEAQGVYPHPRDVFRFTETPLRDVKVVILGQDPYHGPGQADGLAFSVQAGTKVPPSLKNIFRELCDDVGTGALAARQGDHRINGDLTPWTRQGVLLLNTALTVQQGKAGSHLNVWQSFTDEVVRAVVDSAEVAPHFILWGSKARATFERAVGLIDRLPPITDGILKVVYLLPRAVTCTYSAHPSPLSADRGFFGSRPFSRANLALHLNNPGVSPIDWRLP